MVRSWIAVVALLPALRAEDITPRIGVIEIYGVHKVSVKKIRSALDVTEGDALPASRGDAEDRISKISGVIAAHIEAVCCSSGKIVLYVGIEEKNGRHVDFRQSPTGDVMLPKDLVDTYHGLMDAIAGSIRGHNADEDLTNGYSLMADPECREMQQSFIPIVASNLALVDRVLRESSDSEQRAIAAYVIQYGPRDSRGTKTIINGLQYALQDQELAVRQNAIRSLKAVAVGAKLHPQQEIRIEPTWFIELMNSVFWSDRRGASLALVDLAEKRDPETLELLRQRALASVIEMARWHDLEHALPAFILAGRLAGLNEQQIQAAWVAGDRESVIRVAMNGKGKADRGERDHSEELSVIGLARNELGTSIGPLPFALTCISRRCDSTCSWDS